jgi:hypothetical protein
MKIHCDEQRRCPGDFDNEWEIMADTHVQFSRNGVQWPNKDCEVRIETFCFYRN